MNSVKLEGEWERAGLGKDNREVNNGIAGVHDVSGWEKQVLSGSCTAT